MSIAVATAHAAGQAALVAGAACALARPIAALVRRTRGTRLAWVLWGALLLPAVTPSLLVGYAYWGTSLSLVRQPWLNEAMYAALMAARYVPVAALVVYFSPAPPLTDESRFCASLVPAGRVVSARAWLVHGPGRAVAVGTGVVFLLAFQEFEIASLMGVTRWTVWLFDAQVGGLPLTDTLRYAALPVAVEVAVLVPLGAILLTRTGETGGRDPRPRGRWSGALAATWLAAAAIAAALGPLVGVLWEVLGDVGSLARTGNILPDLRVSLAYAAAAAALALLLIAATATRGSAARVLVSLPGLFGSLVLALVILALFQRTPLTGLYDTPVPWALTLVLLLMPLATLLALLVGALARRESLHVAAHMREASRPAVRAAGRRITWAMRGRPWFWVAGLLVFVAYFDLAAGAMLAPSGDTPATVTLYNLMHYGHNAVLSAMTMVSVLALLLTLAAARGAVEVMPSLPRPWRRATGTTGEDGV